MTFVIFSNALPCAQVQLYFILTLIPGADRHQQAYKLSRECKREAMGQNHVPREEAAISVQSHIYFVNDGKNVDWPGMMDKYSIFLTEHGIWERNISFE